MAASENLQIRLQNQNLRGDRIVLRRRRAVRLRERQAHNLSPAPELGRRCLILADDHRLVFDGPIDEAPRDQALLARANLTHRHRHRHGALGHSHERAHDWN